ncbi:IS1096 element passenger TnpR family protein [Magnetococcales bacterium HHB-1]
MASLSDLIDVQPVEEKEREAFREMLHAFLVKFEADLLDKFTQKTVRRHVMTVEMFVEFLCNYTDVEHIEDVTEEMVYTGFYTWYKRKVADLATESNLKTGLHKFFRFLADREKIINEEVLKALSRRSSPAKRKGVENSSLKLGDIDKKRQTVVVRVKLFYDKRTYRDLEVPVLDTLYSLAENILSAFDFDNDHAFGFYDTHKPRGIYDALRKFELFTDMGSATDFGVKGVKGSAVSELLDHVKQKAVFLFDYGDDWMFELEVREFKERVAGKGYPLLLASKGEAPEQYPDWEEA